MKAVNTRQLLTAHPNERLAENYKTATAFCFYVLVIIGVQVLQRVFKTDAHQTIKKKK